MSVTISAIELTRHTPELHRWRVDVTFDTSYPTGGEVVDVTPYLDAIDEVVVQTPVTNTGHVVSVDDATFSAGTFKALLYYGDYSNASDGPLVQVPNTTNVATAVATFIVSGKQFG